MGEPVVSISSQLPPDHHSRRHINLVAEDRSTVERRDNELPRDWQNVFFITGVSFIAFFYIHFTGLKNIVRYTEVFVIGVRYVKFAGKSVKLYQPEEL